MDEISKSVVGGSWVIQKATVNPDGSVNVEGWISTNAEDIEKDIIEPEAFSGEVLSRYFTGGAPISVEHDTKPLPVGFMQKAALVRDGMVFQTQDNPRHPPAEFSYFPGEGTGWYGLAVIDDENASRSVVKGKLANFSWIGMPKAWTPRPGGGRHYSTPGAIDPLVEATLTAYPVNPYAMMRIAKALGYPVEPPSPPRRKGLSLSLEDVERVLSERNK